MQARPLDDPRSWRYQAAVHGYDRATDPLVHQSDRLPADQSAVWNQCQHNSWFFLPWHRGYVAYFEQIVRAEIVALGGPDEWALPYWNYSEDQPDAHLVRSEFREPHLPDGSENALAKARRGRTQQAARHGAATGNFGLDADDVDLTCLRTDVFDSPPEGGSSSFGEPQTGFNHDGGSAIGDLEAVPHGSVHVGIGGWMGAFETAALDPLFWLHHANVDRLWEVWLNRPSSGKNPHEAAWLSEIAFPLHDARGNLVKFTASEVVDTSRAPLSYVYDNVADPTIVALAGLAEEDAAGEDVVERRRKAARNATLIGASDQPVALSGRAKGQVTIDDRARGAALAVDDDARLFLNLENVVGSANATAYKVYVNAPDHVESGREHYAGLLPTFGVAEASGKAALHGGGGLTRVLDITDLVARLRARGEWNESKFTVTFVPKHGELESHDLSVGRISLFQG